MPTCKIAILGLLTLAVTSGCGGGGQGQDPTPDPPSGPQFSASIKIVGGTLARSVTVGQKVSVVLLDRLGHPHTLPGTRCLDTIPKGQSVVVLRAGSLLFGGHYTAPVATYATHFASPAGTAKLPLDSQGRIMDDTVIPSGTTNDDATFAIDLPIDTCSGCTLHWGVQVAFDTNFTSVAEQQLQLTAGVDLKHNSAQSHFTFTGGATARGSADLDLGGNALFQTPEHITNVQTYPSPVSENGIWLAPSGVGTTFGTQDTAAGVIVYEYYN